MKIRKMSDRSRVHYKFTIRGLCKYNKATFRRRSKNSNKFYHFAYHQNEDIVEELVEGYQHINKISDTYEDNPFSWYKNRISEKFSKCRCWG